MQRSVRLRPSAIHLVLHFMTASRPACVRPEARSLHYLPIGPWILRSLSGAEEVSFDKPSEFAGALRAAMSKARDIELLFAIWEQNVETVRALNGSLKQDQLTSQGLRPSS
jgi:hypothetical protein